MYNGRWKHHYTAKADHLYEKKREIHLLSVSEGLAGGAPHKKAGVMEAQHEEISML